MLIKKSDLGNLKIKGVVHVGAHECEELNTYLSLGVDRIIWIEANPGKYAIIEEKISNFSYMHLFKFAAGSEEKKISLNISNNGQSSSLLDLGSHAVHYPHIKYISKVCVNVKPIDKYMDESGFDLAKFNFLNLDIQGYELEALRGCTNLLRNIDYVYTEINYEQVYKNNATAHELTSFLSIHGFNKICENRTAQGWGDAFFAKAQITT